VCVSECVSVCGCVFVQCIIIPQHKIASSSTNYHLLLKVSP